MKNKLLNSILLIITVFINLVSNQAFAQDSTAIKLNIKAGADIVSRYVWRGTQYGGNSPSVQPSITLNYNNFEIGAWGAYSVGGINTSQEMDLHISYTFLKDMFTATVTDYFFPDNSINYNYFNYGKTTSHVYEAGLSFNGTGQIPLSFSAYVNFYGADAPTIGSNPADTTTFNQKIGIQYSNYFEIDYSNSLNKIDYNIFIGFTLNSPKKADPNTGYIGESGFYGNGPGVVNLGITTSKPIKISNDFSLPVSVSLITNPQARKVFLTFGISF